MTAKAQQTSLNKGHSTKAVGFQSLTATNTNQNNIKYKQRHKKSTNYNV